MQTALGPPHMHVGRPVFSRVRNSGRVPLFTLTTRGSLASSAAPRSTAQGLRTDFGYMCAGRTSLLNLKLPDLGRQHGDMFPAGAQETPNQSDLVWNQTRRSVNGRTRTGRVPRETSLQAQAVCLTTAFPPPPWWQHTVSVTETHQEHTFLPTGHLTLTPMPGTVYAFSPVLTMSHLWLLFQHV